MNYKSSLLAIVIIMMIAPCVNAQKIIPVTPNASPESVALLAYLQSLSGKHTLSGQHNFPISRDKNTQFAAGYIGKTPVVWSQDFGFARDGDKDSYLARPSVIEEAVRQHKLGAIVTLCWHAVPPTAEEPITFQPLPGYDTTALASVQGKLLDKQFKDILTPGTKLYKQWIKQVDEIAMYLKQLQDAKVPVLWRPYHEMNGDWFWWGGRYEGKYTTAALYRQIFDRLVKHHKLNNLIWVWSVDRPGKPGREFDKYYPGNQYLDILAIDIYGNDFSQSYYDGLMALSQGKPIALGEVGNPPSVDILNKQPNWNFWVVWSGMTRGTSHDVYEKITADARTVFMEDAAYTEGTKEYRKACGFAPLMRDATDFTGAWTINEYESIIQNAGPTYTPYKLNIVQKDNELYLKSTSVVEWADDEVTEQTLTLDGKEVLSTIFNTAPRVQHASWSPGKDTLLIDSKVTFNLGNRPMEIKSKDSWQLKRKGKKLVIVQTVNSRNGEKTSILVYDKQP
jgi:mannan endo-1,4-beta-mannosidase